MTMQNRPLTITAAVLFVLLGLVVLQIKAYAADSADVDVTVDVSQVFALWIHPDDGMGTGDGLPKYWTTTQGDFFFDSEFECPHCTNTHNQGLTGSGNNFGIWGVIIWANCAWEITIGGNQEFFTPIQTAGNPPPWQHKPASDIIWRNGAFNAPYTRLLWDMDEVYASDDAPSDPGYYWGGGYPDDIGHPLSMAVLLCTAHDSPGKYEYTVVFTIAAKST